MKPDAKKLKILYATPELSPLVSTGGLAEVAGALPRALHGRGHDVRCVMPCHGGLPAAARGTFRGTCIADMGTHTEYGALRESTVPDSEIPLYLIEHEGYFGRTAPYGDGTHEFMDNAERYTFFCIATLDALVQTGWKPDIVHLNDWATAPLAALLRTRFARHPFWRDTKIVLTIHNLAFQGRYSVKEYARTGLGEELFSRGHFEFHGDMNLLQGAIAFADKINTVSPRYAKEIQTREYGEGLDGALRMRAKDLSGILNGVDYDVWHPRQDNFIAKTFGAKTLKAKAVCKRDLQECMHLPLRDDIPLFGVVSRFYWQKGLDLLAEAVTALRQVPFQLAILGSGNPEIERDMRHISEAFPEKIGLTIGYDTALSHKIMAGSDFFLMPSRYEPCGLSQLYSMAYGTVPIVRRTGGLVDSVVPRNLATRDANVATGLGFVPKTSAALRRAMEDAVSLYGCRDDLLAMQQRGMKADFSWEQSSAKYVELYQAAIRVA